MAPQIIVCDEPHIIRAISLKFMRADFDVKGATDTESCWRLLHQHEPPSVLIVDDSLASETDGLDFVRRLRADARLAHLPIILLTSKRPGAGDNSDPTTNGQLVELNIAQVVTKPFSPRELLTTVQDLLGHESESQTQRPRFAAPVL